MKLKTPPHPFLPEVEQNLLLVNVTIILKNFCGQSALNRFILKKDATTSL